MAECRSCGAPISWAEHFESGKKMPLEPAPETARGGGLFVIFQGGGKTFARPTKVHPAYRSHFVTCPDAQSWRRREPRKRRRRS